MIDKPPVLQNPAMGASQQNSIMNCYMEGSDVEIEVGGDANTIIGNRVSSYPGSGENAGTVPFRWRPEYPNDYQNKGNCLLGNSFHYPRQEDEFELSYFNTISGKIEAQEDIADGSIDGQMILEGKTDRNRMLWAGYDTTNNYGMIQAYEQTVGPKNLVLQPAGGAVGIGKTNPNLDTKLDVDGPIAVKAYFQAERPDASKVPAGTMIYNLNGNMPNWSDGTDWRDAEGTLIGG